MDLAGSVTTMLDAAWRDAGYCVPNPATYPWQWCWDSGFHAVVWAHLRPRRAITEVQALFTAQSDDGFVPHMTYHDEPSAARPLWGRDTCSTITNPPMYGHALRVLADGGTSPPPALVAAAGRGLAWLLEHRVRDDGLVVACHPWETGCDDTPRWDGFLGGDAFAKPAWDRRKRALLAAGEVRDGAVVANPAFEVAAASFNALVAFNLAELAVVDPSGPWADHAQRVTAAMAARWDGSTWTDGDHAGADAPTLEALLGVLVDPRPEAWDALDAHRGRCGLWQVRRDHPGVDPTGYWRGASWAPLEYLFWVAALRQGRDELATELASAFVRGARASGLAEYWHPEHGDGHGARPQTWTALALLAQRWLAGHEAPA